MKNLAKILFVLLLINSSINAKNIINNSTFTNFEILFNGEKTEVLNQVIVNRAMLADVTEHRLKEKCFHYEFIVKDLKPKNDLLDDSYNLTLKFYNNEGILISKINVSDRILRIQKGESGLWSFSIPIYELPLTIMNIVNTVNISVEDRSIWENDIP
jgi:hypothetical protein